jgi:hypothetical protein
MAVGLAAVFEHAIQRQPSLIYAGTGGAYHSGALYVTPLKW